MKVNEIDWILDPEQEKGGLAVANIRYFEQGRLNKDKVNAVISVFGEKDLVLPTEIHHLRILIGDHPKQNISIFFQSSYNFIETHRKSGNVVVHCQAGVSRSVSLVMAYIIRKYRVGYQQAFAMVKKRRPIANPNKGFVKQLRRFADEVKTMPVQIKQSSCRIF